MSAFIVSKAHIDALVAAGLAAGRPSRCALRWRVAEPELTENMTLESYTQALRAVTRELRHDTADAVGAMLWRENVASVRGRYPDIADNLEDAPGPIGLTPAELHGYTFPVMTRHRKPVEILKAIACYEYQSCEHPEWATSEAKAFCDALRLAMVHMLPGYEDAEWEITR